MFSTRKNILAILYNIFLFYIYNIQKKKINFVRISNFTLLKFYLTLSPLFTAFCMNVCFSTSIDFLRLFFRYAYVVFSLAMRECY